MFWSSVRVRSRCAGGWMRFSAQTGVRRTWLFYQTLTTSTFHSVNELIVNEMWLLLLNVRASEPVWVKYTGQHHFGTAHPIMTLVYCCFLRDQPRQDQFPLHMQRRLHSKVFRGDTKYKDTPSSWVDSENVRLPRQQWCPATMSLTFQERRGVESLKKKW